MTFFSESLARLVAELEKLPGVGPKSAQRIAYWMLKRPAPEGEALAASIREVKERVTLCRECLQFCEGEVCKLCLDPARSRAQLCVVEQPSDVIAIERTRAFNGLYQVLHGALSPLDGITPADLRITDLLQRLQKLPIEEVVLATNPTVEGEATALYLSRLIKPVGVRVTRLVHGLPMGADLEYADEVTLARALTGRREL